MARIELMDDLTIDAVNQYSKLSLPQKNLLLLEFHGTEAGSREQAEMVQAIAAEHGGGDFALDQPGRGAHQAVAGPPRRSLGGARRCGRAAACGRPTSACRSRKLAECILETPRPSEPNDLCAPIVGHVGDGNFHLTMMVDTNDPTRPARAEGLNDRMIARARDLGGTCTGEHGIGLGKIKYLTRNTARRCR